LGDRCWPHLRFTGSWLAVILPAGDDGVVDDEVVRLARPRQGHFDLGTGFHGDLWLDLDALFLRPAALRPHVRMLAARLGEHQPDAVCGPMEGGAFLAQAIADALGAAFLPAARALAPWAAGAAAYLLPRVPGGISGWRVAIADDAVNAGTAVATCAQLLRDRGAVPVAVAALIALGPASTAVAQAISVPFYAAGSMQSRAWPAGQCPRCATGVPLTEHAAGE
jgi:orotate phosphoribosyltransferase